MKATFTAEPNTFCEVFGKTFPFSIEVDVSDLPPAQLKKLRGNPAFEVSEKALSTKKDA